ncbi:uncharacterized protein LOC143537409 [Bidens hawaiensis]|uniref:uncharacterized protein LOC143537409 n=1 Tax=Bidens hawaiensis TaxID=980011 RepID=UPI004049C133
MDGIICGRWDWSRQPIGPILVEEFRDLLTVSQHVLLESGFDKTIWCGDPSGAFSVRNFKRILVDKMLVRPASIFDWNNWIPKKVGFVAWRAMLNRLPTLDALARRNISINSLVCPACGSEEESVDHVFISCVIAQKVWCLISQWCKVPSIYAFSVRDLVELHLYSLFPKDKAKALHAVCLVTMWCLWKKRNELIHNGVPI